MISTSSPSFPPLRSALCKHDGKTQEKLQREADVALHRIQSSRGLLPSLLVYAQTRGASCPLGVIRGGRAKEEMGLECEAAATMSLHRNARYYVFFFVYFLSYYQLSLLLCLLNRAIFPFTIKISSAATSFPLLPMQEAIMPGGLRPRR